MEVCEDVLYVRIPGVIVRMRALFRSNTHQLLVVGYARHFNRDNARWVLQCMSLAKRFYRLGFCIGNPGQIVIVAEQLAHDGH